jgi:hypothetical protein
MRLPPQSTQRSLLHLLTFSVTFRSGAPHKESVVALQRLEAWAGSQSPARAPGVRLENLAAEEDSQRLNFHFSVSPVLQLLLLKVEKLNREKGNMKRLPRKIHLRKQEKRHGKSHPNKTCQQGWLRFYYGFKRRLING